MLKRSEIVVIGVLFLLLSGILYHQNTLLGAYPLTLSGLVSSDEYDFTLEIRRHHQLYDKAEFGKAFVRANSGYGNIFWSTYALITYPFYLFGQDKIVGILQRQLSLFFYFLGIFLSYLFFRSEGASRSSSMSVIFIIATIPIGHFVALTFQSNALLFAAVSGFFYCWSRSRSSRCFEYLAFAMVGFAEPTSPVIF